MLGDVLAGSVQEEGGNDGENCARRAEAERANGNVKCFKSGTLYV